MNDSTLLRAILVFGAVYWLNCAATEAKKQEWIRRVVYGQKTPECDKLQYRSNLGLSHCVPDSSEVLRWTR